MIFLKSNFTSNISIINSKYAKDSITNGISLPNNDSTITYVVKITNIGNQQYIINNSHKYEEYEKINIENKLKIYHKKYDIAKNLADELYNEIFNELVMDDLYKIILKREY